MWIALSIKISIFVIILLLINYVDFKIIQNHNSKVCICTIGKDENRYIREFVQYYDNLGVDKIFLYDNNDKDKEHFEDAINDYINEGFVEILDWRGIIKPQIKAYNDCYINNNKQYDWLIFYDIDEYIHLTRYTNIKDFLGQNKFNNCKKIYLNWVFHTDNNLIQYENASLHDRFPEIERDAIINVNYTQKVKSILRGNITNFKISNHNITTHVITDGIKGCNAFGKKIELQKGGDMKNSDNKHYYIDHYYTKSLEEFVNKIKRGSAVNGKDDKFTLFRIIRYFNINKLKYSKYNYIMKNITIKFET